MVFFSFADILICSWCSRISILKKIDDGIFFSSADFVICSLYLIFFNGLIINGVRHFTHFALLSEIQAGLVSWNSRFFLFLVDLFPLCQLLSLLSFCICLGCFCYFVIVLPVFVCVVLAVSVSVVFLYWSWPFLLSCLFVGVRCNPRPRPCSSPVLCVNLWGGNIWKHFQRRFPWYLPKALHFSVLAPQVL